MSSSQGWLGASPGCLFLSVFWRKPRETGQIPLAGGVNIRLTHTKGTNTDLSPWTLLEKPNTRILSSWQSSDCTSGFTSRRPCLSAVVTAANIAVKAEVNCSCCLRAKAKIYLKALCTREQPLSLYGFAPSHICRWQFLPWNYTLYPPYPHLISQ